MTKPNKYNWDKLFKDWELVLWQSEYHDVETYLTGYTLNKDSDVITVNYYASTPDSVFIHTQKASEKFELFNFLSEQERRSLVDYCENRMEILESREKRLDVIDLLVEFGVIE